MRNPTLHNKKNILLALEKKAKVSVNKESKAFAFTFFKIILTVLCISFVAYSINSFFKKKKEYPPFSPPPIVNGIIEKVLNRFFSLILNIAVDIVLAKIQNYLKNRNEK
ncbi:MAG: hypothetical protein QM536_02180 [Chitinophagaceae bacterium]|nr:hypothetical protein [Chitinophagaceae bacterium]